MATPRRGTILVVEDRADVRQGLSQLLELHGYLVAEARDGEAALSRMAADRGLALVLLDLMLPGQISGRDVRLSQLAEPRLSEIPTFIVTGSEMRETDRQHLRPTAWIEKPFRFDDLLELVKKHVVPEIAAT
jgi:CheY-like chemotaxis protein